jgi:hypothetical protein
MYNPGWLGLHYHKNHHSSNSLDATMTHLQIAHDDELLKMPPAVCVTCSPVGSLAHLAPTLKHLSIWDCEHVQDSNQLTNLKELEVGHHMSKNFFKTQSQLLIEHFYMSNSFSQTFFETPSEWKAAPTTLTRLALDGA